MPSTRPPEVDGTGRARACARALLFVWVALATVLDNPFTAPFNDHTPLTETLGVFLYANLKAQTGLPIPFSPFEWMPVVAALLGARAHARAGRAGELVSEGFVALYVFWTFLFASALVGPLLRGGDASAAFWAVKGPLVVPFACVAAYTLLRGRADIKRLGALACVGITLKALQGLHYYFVTLGGDLGTKEYITTHTGSYLMSVVILAAVGAWTFRSEDMRRARLPLALAAALVVLPAFLFNERRVEMAGLLASLALLAGLAALRSPVRTVITVCVVLAVGAAYFGVFRYADGVLGAPVRMILSLGDEANASNLYRDIENYDVLEAIRRAPLVGAGVGVPFDEVVKLPDISHIYAFYRHNPHNSFLWVWMTMGGVGLFLFLLAFASAGARATRGFLRASDPFARLALFLCLANALRYLLFCQGDMMLFNSEGALVLGLSLGVAFKFSPVGNTSR
jgi:O-antigen ligase